MNRGTNLCLYIEDENYQIKSDLQRYINELRVICERKRNISFFDMDLGYINDYRQNYEIKD